MKHNCDIIKDLLPLYCDGVCSDASKKVVEEHLEECDGCNEVCKNLTADSLCPIIKSDEEENKVRFMKDVKNKILFKKIIFAVVAVAVTLGICFGVYRQCEVPKWGIEYSKDAFTLADYGDNMVAISYNGRDYAKLERIDNITITVDGEEKNCCCIRFLENISSKYITSGKDRRPLEKGGDLMVSKELDCVYYIENGWTHDEVIDIDLMRNKIVNEGVLIWSKE